MKFVKQQKLGQFEIAAHLATGGMAEVYLARDALSRELAVVKMLARPAEAEADLVSMFRQEGRIMANLAHPNVVRILGLGEHANLPYIVMEYLSGDHLGVLYKIVRKSGRMLPASALARIFLQAANALDYVHQAADRQGQALGLVHRDVSPQNICLCYDGRVKLLDFGIALARDRDVFTRTGMLKGKLRYMSPEQINSEPLDGRSDVFSLGVVMWELCTGERLFKASSEFKTMKLICEEPIASPQSRRPDLPDDFVSIVTSCLQRSLDDRFQNAAAVRQALSDFLFSESGESRADELVRLAADLLGERAARKKSFIENVWHQTELQQHLFGDIDDDLEDSEPDRRRALRESSDSFEKIEQPASPAAASSFESPFSQETPPTSTRDAGRSILLVAIGLLVFLLFAGAGWLVCRSLNPAGSGTTNAGRSPDRGIADAGPPQSDQGAAPADADIALPAGDAGQLESPDAGTDGGPDGGDLDGGTHVQDAGETAPQPADPDNVGFLYFDVKPACEIYLDGRFLGKTPIVNMPIAPGRYRLKLLNESAGISKHYNVKIRKNQVTSEKVIY